LTFAVLFITAWGVWLWTNLR